jgi:NADPH:quinone reductase-like Zn-dependent oxidoreductase
MKHQQMMRAAVLHGLGETPRYEPFPAPLATDGEAVVTVTAAALKPSDRWMANGVHHARTEFARVEQVWPQADSDRRIVFVP